MTDLGVELVTYAVLVGAAQVAVSLALLLPVTGLVLTRGWGWYRRLAVGVLQFNVLLLVLGDVAHVVVQALTFGRMYVSHDTLMDWTPFIPFGPWALEPTFGGVQGHLVAGASLNQLRVIWAVFAAVVWAATIAFFVAIRRRRRVG
jgi:hypothetical protein